MGQNEVRVVLLGRSDGLVAEELLNGADVRALAEQLDGEGVPEAVRVGMNLGDGAEALNGSAQVATARVGVTVTGPEEVIGVFGGQGLKGGLSVRVKEHLEVNVGLHGSQREVPCSRIEGGSAQFGDVRDAEPTVEERVDQSEGPLADVARLGGVGARDLVTCRNNLPDFLAGEWERRHILNPGFTDFLGRVIGAPVAVLAPREEHTQMRNLFPPGARLQLAVVAVERGHVNGCDIPFTEPLRKAVEGTGVDPNGGPGEVALLAVLEKCGYSTLDGLAGVSAFWNEVPARLQYLNAARGPLPTGRIKGLSEAASVQLSISPDGALAERVIPAFRGVFTGVGMTPMEGQHVTILTQFCHTILSHFDWMLVIL